MGWSQRSKGRGQRGGAGPSEGGARRKALSHWPQRPAWERATRPARVPSAVAPRAEKLVSPPPRPPAGPVATEPLVPAGGKSVDVRTLAPTQSRVLPLSLSVSQVWTSRPGPELRSVTARLKACQPASTSPQPRVCVCVFRLWTPALLLHLSCILPLPSTLWCVCSVCVFGAGCVCACKACARRTVPACAGLLQNVLSCKNSEVLCTKKTTERTEKDLEQRTPNFEQMFLTPTGIKMLV